MTTYRNTYILAGPFMDTTRPPDTLPDGVLSRLWGVDGRIKGSLRRFPGCIDVNSVNANEGVSVQYNANYFDSITFANPLTFMRLVIFMVGVDNPIRCMLAVIWDGSVKYSQFYRGILNSSGNLPAFPGGVSADFATLVPGINLSYSEPLSVVTGSDDTFYVFQRASVPQYVRMNTGGSIAASGDMGVGTHIAGEMLSPTYNSGFDTGTGGFLNFRGSYSVAYKLYDSVRDVATGLSTIGTVTLTGFNMGVNILASVRFWENDNNFDQIRIYRSTNLRDPLDIIQGGVLFLEQTLAYTGGSVIHDIGTLHDTALVQQERYDPFADPVVLPPQSGVAIFYENTVWAAQDPAINGGVGIVWTNPNKANSEEFGSQYQYNGLASDGRPLRMIIAGDNMFVLTSAVVYKVRKVGSQIAISRFVLDRGLVGPLAITSFDRDLILVTWQGLVIINGETGASSLFVSLEGFFRDDWNWNLRTIELAYDSDMGCTFVFHPTFKEMICIWDATRAATLLKNCDFVKITDAIKWSSVSGATTTVTQLPATQKKAYFISPSGGVCCPDSQGVGPGTMSGLVTGWYQGTSNTTDNIGLEDANASFGSEIIGRRIYVTQGSLVGQYGIVNSVPSVTQVLFTGGSPLTNWPGGTGYAIDPVIFEAKLGSVKGLSPQPDPFTRKLVNTVELAVWKPSGVGDKFVVGFYRNGGTSSEVSQDIDVTGFIPDSLAHIEVDGNILEPFIIHISSNGMFELTHLSVKGTITISRDSVE